MLVSLVTAARGDGTLSAEEPVEDDTGWPSFEALLGGGELASMEGCMPMWYLDGVVPNATLGVHAATIEANWGHPAIAAWEVDLVAHPLEGMMTTGQPSLFEREIAVETPDIACQPFSLVHIDHVLDRARVWTGIDPLDARPSLMWMVDAAGHRAAWLQEPDFDTYLLLPIGEGHWLVQIDTGGHDEGDDQDTDDPAPQVLDEGDVASAFADTPPFADPGPWSPVASPTTADVLVSYTDLALAEWGLPQIENIIGLNVAWFNLASARSRSDARVRLIGLEEVIGTNEAGLTPGEFWQRFRSGHAAMLPTIQRRDDYGADLHGILMSSLTCPGGGDCFGGKATNPGLSPSPTAYRSISRTPSVDTLAHEWGHNFGANHDAEAVFGSGTTANPVPGGDICFPAPLGCADLGYISPSDAWRTTMAYGTGCSECPRVPVWSDYTVAFDLDGPGSGGPEPAGVGLYDVHNAVIVATNAPVVAGYRSCAGDCYYNLNPGSWFERGPDVFVGIYLRSGVVTGSSGAFKITSRFGTEVGLDDILPEDIHCEPPISCGTGWGPFYFSASAPVVFATVSTWLAPDQPPIVRVTRIAADVPVDCSADPGWTSHRTFGAASCDADGFEMCTRTGTTLTCDLRTPDGNTSGPIPRHGHVVSTGGGYWHYVAYGDTDNGTDWCCMYREDQGAAVTTIELQGTGASDVLSFHDAAYPLRPPTGLPLTANAYGRNGPDILDGSAATDPGFFETLNGQRQADELWLREGGNIGRGGLERDELYGLLGTKVLVDEGGVDDLLWTGTGDDTLCAQGTSPLLLATLGLGAPGEFNTLYLSSLATPDPASDASGWFGDTPRCGHPVHGTSWAGSCWYDPSFTLNPSVCAGVAP